jgi:alpha-L-fucosidase
MRRREAVRLIPGVAAGLLAPRVVAPPASGDPRPDEAPGRPGAETGVPPPADLSWWREARFGMFVHWGPVSLRGTEIGWSRGDAIPVEEYDALYRRFDPRQFDARAWARLARDAGMGYLVLTTKHHDGFCLWASALTDYDIAGTPFGRDVVRELADACRAEGVVFCAYHSICDWRHPDYPLGSPGGKTRKPNPDMGRYVAYLEGQLAELLRGYGPLGILWFDGEWEEPWTEAHGRELYRYCRGLQPSLIVNNRVAKGREDMAGTTAAGAFGGDYDTPEQRVGRFQADRPWESCITIGTQWAWRPDEELKSTDECVRTLVTCAGGDGNLLLNVGPMPSGEIEPRQAARLREVGAWLSVHGESVRGTRGGPFLPGPWGVSTHRDRTVFVHVLDWPPAGPLVLPPLERTVVSADVPRASTPPAAGDTASAAPAEVARTAAGTEIRVRPEHRLSPDTVVRLTLDGPAESLPPL